MACTKTCKNCALYGNTWADTCTSPRQINSKGECIWWESKDFWAEVCADIDESHTDIYVGKHVRPQYASDSKRKKKAKVPIVRVARLAYAKGENE